MPDSILRCCRRLVALWSRGSGVLTGALLGALLIVWWAQTLSSFGGTFSILCGLLTAAGLGAAWGWRSPSASRLSPAGPAAWVGLAIWTSVMPLLCGWFFRCVGVMSGDAIGQPTAEFVIAFAAGGWLLFVPHYCLAVVLRGESIRARHGWPATSALALTVVLLPTIVLSRLSLTWVGIVTSLLSVAFACRDWLRLSSGTATPSPAAPIGRPARAHFMLRDLGPAGLAGGLLAIASQLVGQLWSFHLATGFALAGGCLLGWSLGRRWSHRITPLSNAAHVPIAGAMAAGAALILTGSFSLLTHGQLWLNGGAASETTRLGLQSLFAVVLALPAGLLLGIARPDHAGEASATREAIGLLLFIIGWAVVRGAFPSPAAAAATLALLGCVQAFADWRSTGFVRPRRRLGILATGAAIAGAILSPWCLSQYDPVQSARQLFSSRAALAARTSTNHDLLTALDDARPIETHMGADAVWTTWKRHGEYLQLRENGLPAGQVVLNRGVAPESMPELMAGSLPLMVHPRADDVLVVGLGSGAAIRSGLESPVQSLTCWEQDGDLIALLPSSLPIEEAGFFSDPRLNLRRIHPVWGAAARTSRRYDVIVLNETSFGAWRTLGQHHREAYGRWKQLLKPDGLLCQRFEFHELGAQPLLDLTRTLSAVFPQVVLWESAPGELLMLASLQERALINSGMVARFETPQARRLFGGIGWDYSHPLNIVTIAGPQLLASDPDGGTVATAAAAHFEFSLPRTAAASGSPIADVHRLLAPLAASALKRIPSMDSHKALTQRLEDVVEQRKLITQYPDHYWAYRKTLRERLQERPRSVIVQMKHELHPDDERRRDYLEALGVAATAGAPTPAQLAAVAEFAEPFDPLITPFLHRELAKLCAQAQPYDPKVELQHWLHAVYFSPSYDRSIRDATETLRVLLEHPNAMPDATERWDHINALVEILKERWTLRSQQQTVSRFEGSDVSETMDVSQRALEALGSGALAAGIDPDWAATRVQVLERTFVRALRTHHAQQVARQKAVQRQQTAMEASKAAQAQ